MLRPASLFFITKPIMIKTMCLFGVVALVSTGTASKINEEKVQKPEAPVQNRFDYEYSETVEGWLKLHQVPATWQDARLRCNAEGAVLASPLNNQLKEAIIEFVSNKMQRTESLPNKIFTGVHDSFSQGNYNSIEGVPLSRLPVTWAADDTNNLDNIEGCLVMNADDEGTIADSNCGNVFPFVCYKLNITTIKKIQNECGTTDPEYHLHADTGSCYKLHPTKTHWKIAFSTCAGEGGHLAVPNSRQEAMYLASLIQDVAKWPITWVFIGFHDWGSYGFEWKTIDGKSLAEAGYDRWNNGEPNNITILPEGDAGEYCGSLCTNGMLNDAQCNDPLPFLCELTPRA